jgi:hypothetical protein
MDSDTAGTLAALFSGVFLIVGLVIGVVMIASMWKVFTKAGQPGWAVIVPIYNVVILLKIVVRPTWWLILFLIPLVSLIVAIIIYIDLAKSFGKSAGFGIGLILLCFIFFPILGFGDAKYVGPASAA